MLEIHASKLDDFADCPLRAAASMLKKEFAALGLEARIVPQWISATVGTGIHKGVAELHFGKSVQEAVVAARAEFRVRKVKDNATYTSKFPNDTIIDAHIEEYVVFYSRSVQASRTPKLIEQNFKYTIRADITMDSTIDLYTSEDSLNDLKTGDIVTPAWNQLGMYLFLLVQHGHKPRKAMLDYLRRPKDGYPVGHEPYVYAVEHCLETSKRTVARLIKDYDNFNRTNDPRVFTTNPRSSNCNSRMCPLFGTNACPSWDKSRGVACHT